MAAPVYFEYEDIVDYTKSFSKKVSEGGSALVYKGKIPRGNPYNLPKQKIAVKRLITIEKIQQFENEIRWLEAFQHEGIVQYLGNCRTGDGFFIVLEYIRKTDLKRNINSLSWNDTLIILRRVAATISYIHSFSPNPPAPGLLVIGDLKCQNILLDKGNRPKLCDFGIIEAEGSVLYGYTPMVVDPDAYRRKRIMQRDDLYCFGIIILQLIMKEADVMKEGTRIKDLAEEKLRTDSHLVHPNLLQSGCSISDAVNISGLAVKLTQTKKPREAPSFARNTFDEVLGKAKKKKGGIEDEEAKKKKGEIEEDEEAKKEKGEIEEEEAKKEKGEIEEEADGGDNIHEVGASTSGNGDGKKNGSGSENESVSGRGNGSGNVSVSSEEPNRETIQEAIETLESLTLKQSKSKRERATEKLQKWFNWFKKSFQKLRE